MRYMKELKFLGIIIFCIFSILLLVFLIALITFIRFRCPEFINHMQYINKQPPIESILPKLKTGDIIVFGGKLSKNHIKNKIKCFIYSRYNFTPNNYLYEHTGIIYRKNNIIYLIESIFKADKCKNLTSLVSKNYVDGLRIQRLDKIINEYKNSCKKNPNCCTIYGIRFINPKFSQKELNRRFENEFNILSDVRFNNWNTIQKISISGWFISDIPLEIQYGVELFFPEDERDTTFCSEMTAILLQRVGLMKRTFRSRMFFPSFFTGFLDQKMFPPNFYYKIKIFK